MRVRSQHLPIMHCVLLAALLIAAAAQGATLPSAAKGEIDSLLTRLEASGCQFKRNGSWHTAGEARMHLQRKLEYLLDRKSLASAEQFIELAASRSSMSGQPYWVRCGGVPPVESRVWLTDELRGLRARSTR